MYRTSEVKRERDSVGEHGPTATSETVAVDFLSINRPVIFRLWAWHSDEHPGPRASHWLWVYTYHIHTEYKLYKVFLQLLIPLKLTCPLVVRLRPGQFYAHPGGS